MRCLQRLTLQDGRIVDCEKCYNCKLNRINGWVLRLQEQRKCHKEAYFITLTYEDEKNTPSSNRAPYTKSGRRTLVKRDLQLYFKRVNQALTRSHGASIKYYGVGEYGRRSLRPHYHAIVFGAPKDLLRKQWLFGFVHVGSVTSSSCAYCLKYISKGRIVPVDNTDDRSKEFSLFSKRLGARYLQFPSNIEWHQSDPAGRLYVPRNGFKYPLPRYYRERIFTSAQKAEIEMHFTNEWILSMCTMYEGFTPEKFREWQKQKRTTVEGYQRMMAYLSLQKEKL